MPGWIVGQCAWECLEVQKRIAWRVHQSKALYSATKPSPWLQVKSKNFTANYYIYSADWLHRQQATFLRDMTWWVETGTSETFHYSCVYWVRIIRQPHLGLIVPICWLRIREDESRAFKSFPFYTCHNKITHSLLILPQFVLCPPWRKMGIDAAARGRTNHTPLGGTNIKMPHNKRIVPSSLNLLDDYCYTHKVSVVENFCPTICMWHYLRAKGVLTLRALWCCKPHERQIQPCISEQNKNQTFV